MSYTHPYASDDKDDYVFFWRITEPNGWASQWYTSPFRARIDIHIRVDSPDHNRPDAPPIRIQSAEEHVFPTAEHWMMACKALLFNDHTSFAQVLSSSHSNPSESTLKEIKALGRRVANFDEQTWLAARYPIVLEGTLLKFRQNLDLKRKLLRTGERWIVEASPLDRVWGVGFGEKRALEGGVRERWGLNLLGRALMDVRRVLREEEGLSGSGSG